MVIRYQYPLRKRDFISHQIHEDILGQERKNLCYAKAFFSPAHCWVQSFSKLRNQEKEQEWKRAREKDGAVEEVEGRMTEKEQRMLHVNNTCGTNIHHQC